MELSGQGGDDPAPWWRRFTAPGLHSIDQGLEGLLQGRGEGGRGGGRGAGGEGRGGEGVGGVPCVV